MAKDIHEVATGLLEQSDAESIFYSVNTLPWGGSPSAPSVDVFNENDLDTSVKTAVMPAGSPSVNGNSIDLPALTALTDKMIYRIYLTFTSGGNVLRCYFRVEAKD